MKHLESSAPTTRWLGGAIATGALIGLGAVVTTNDITRNRIIDTVKGTVGPTETETRIGSALEQTIGKQVIVRCAAMPQSVQHERAEHSAATGQQVRMYGFTYMPSKFKPNVVRLDPDVCAAVDALADITTIPRQSPSTTSFNDTVQLASRSIPEGAHVLDPTLSESDTDCRAMQLMDEFSVALGQTPARAKNIQQTALQLWQSSEPVSSYVTPPEYQPDPSRCHDEGVLDLHPGVANAQEFPAA
jgi:hypothetical protein